MHLTPHQVHYSNGRRSNNTKKDEKHKVDGRNTKSEEDNDSMIALLKKEQENAIDHADKLENNEFTSNEEPLAEEMALDPIDLTAIKPIKNNYLKKQHVNPFNENRRTLVDLLTLINTDDLDDMKKVKDQETNSVRRKRKTILFPIWCDKTHPQGAWLRYHRMEHHCKGY